mgnify:CR=1 FL=1
MIALHEGTASLLAVSSVVNVGFNLKTRCVASGFHAGLTICLSELFAGFQLLINQYPLDGEPKGQRGGVTIQILLLCRSQSLYRRAGSFSLVHDSSGLSSGTAQELGSRDDRKLAESL